MAQQTQRIEQKIMDEPHVSGRRVSVRQLHAAVEGANRHPVKVADQLKLDVAEVYAALAYYYDHLDEMEAIEANREELEASLRQEIQAERPAGVSPPE